MLLRVMVAIFCLISVMAAVLTLRAGSIVQFALSQAGCEFSAEESGLSFFPTRFEAKAVQFRQGREADTAIRAEADAVEIPISLLPLVTGRIRLGRVILHRPRVEVIEGDEDDTGEESRPPDLAIEAAEIRDGQFRYRRIYPGKHATISVYDINGQVGSLNARSSAASRGRVRARLEQSGRVDLTVTAAYFAPTPDVTVDLEILGQRLAELNPYFGPADGIKLSGLLRKGRGVVSLKGDVVAASVRAEYTSFDILMLSNRRRSKGEAFLANLLRPLKIDGDNLGEPSYDRRFGLRLKRKKGESVISALVRGLRDSVLQIATT